MATPREQIHNIAARIRDGLQRRVPKLERDIANMETHRREMEAQIQAAHTSVKRLADFPITLGNDYLCPFCWMHYGKKSALKLIGGGTDKKDILKCPSCDAKITINVG